MLEALKLRTLVIGNSGSGKSRLAGGLGALVHAPIFDLDLIHWKDNGHGAKQDEDVARQKVANLAATERWVIEGVYGWLAEVAVPRATTLVWLDIPGKFAERGCSRAVSVAVEPRLIFLSCSNGQKPTGIARHRRPSKVTGVYSKASVLPRLGFRPERNLITYWLISRPTRTKTEAARYAVGQQGLVGTAASSDPTLYAAAHESLVGTRLPVFKRLACMPGILA